MEDYEFKHFENSLGLVYCSVRYHPRHKMVSVIWKGTVPEDSIKIIKDEILALIGRNNCQFLMIDFQGLFTASVELLARLIQPGWENEVFADGIHYIVHVLKPDMEMPVLPEEEAEKVKFFYDKLEAIAWIRNQQEV
jgi:hypothetical protein